MQLTYTLAREYDVVERAVVDIATVLPSAHIISALTPDEQVRAEGARLISPNVRLSVLNGCEGTECLLLLFAAIIAHRAAARDKAAALAAGFLLVYGINQMRIVTLFYVVRYRHDWFPILHGYIAPLFVTGVAAVFFYVWVAWVARRSSFSRNVS